MRRVEPPLLLSSSVHCATQAAIKEARKQLCFWKRVGVYDVDDDDENINTFVSATITNLTSASIPYSTMSPTTPIKRTVTRAPRCAIIRWENAYTLLSQNSCETAKEIWERVRQMMKENIAANLKFLNNLQPEWKRHVTVVRQTKNLHEADFTQIYDILKMNHDENSYNFPATHNDQSTSSTHSQQSFPINNKYNPQPLLNQNFMQPAMTSLEDINDPTEAMNAVLILFAKAFQLTTPTNNNQRTSSNPRNRQIAQPVAQNQQGYNAWQNGGIQVAQNAVQNAGVQNGGNQNGLVVVLGIANQNGTGNIVAARAEGTGNGNQARCYNCRGLGHIARNCTAKSKKRDVAYLQTQLLIAQKEEAEIQLQAEEFDFMAAAGDLDEIEEVNANCVLMANLQHASTSEQYTDLLEPIPEPQLVPQKDNHVTSVAPSMVQSGGTIETSSAPNEE
nr:abscisic aldehyde oxidase 3 [Tanacetum cinerariifolium]